MKRLGIRAIHVNGALLCLLLLVGEFVFPNYVTRIVSKVKGDIALMIAGEPLERQQIWPDDTILSNEFAFQFVAIPDARTQRPAGVLGPDAAGQFVVIDQTAMDIAGRDVAPLLTAMGAWYPEDLAGGIKQLIEIDGALFGLFGLAREGCHFAALIDLDRLEVVEEFPCMVVGPEEISMTGFGGGYAVTEGTVLLLALGVGGGEAWTLGNAAAQDPDSPYGKTLAYDIVQAAGGPRLANRRIFSSGHRNPQGMMAFGDLVLAVEHGAFGGDEINLIEAGANFGWPIYSAGSQYNQGDPIPFAPEGAAFSNPLFTFVPAIAPSDITGCPGVVARRYEPADCVIVSGLISESLFIVLGDFANRRIRSVEQIEMSMRIREIFVDADTLYVVPDHAAVTRVDIVARPCTDDMGRCGDED